jgi:hypothetical protein
MGKDSVLCEAGNKFLHIGDMKFSLIKVKFHSNAGFPVD